MKKMKTSKNGLNLIKKFEGYRDRAYYCSSGVPTIGYGHTRGVKIGDFCTRAQAVKWLKQDIESAERAVNKYMKVYNFNQNEYDALVSFAYNLGGIDQLTAYGTRDRKTIYEKMLLYVKSGGVVNSGLVERRWKERKLFLKKVK